MSFEYADPPEWEEGQVVAWVANPDMVGRIVHTPEDQNILMVELLEKADGEWMPTGYTLTAGYTDVRPMKQMETEYSAEAGGEFGMNVRFSAPAEEALTDGFNRYGVRENDDGSLDVRFDAMEPGVRRGIEITPEFLRRTVRKDYDRIPLQLDHSDSQRANVGYIDPGNIQFNDGVLQVQAHIPDTGSDVRNDVIADFKHEPPQITDISVSFAKDSVEIEGGKSRGETPQFVDGRYREFSLTPFPAGYDEGGLTPAFSSAIDDAIDSESGASASDNATSELIERPHTLIEK